MEAKRTSTEWGAARSQLISAAQEMLLEQFSAERSRPEAIAAVLSFMEPATVAERAGVARSAIHHHWGRPPGDVDDGMTAFQRFIVEVFDTEWGDAVDGDTVLFAAAHGGSLTDLIGVLADVELERWDSPVAWATWRASVALAAYGGTSVEAMDEIQEGVAQFHDLMRERFGLAMRAPLQPRDMAAAVMAFLEGLMLQRTYGVADPNPKFSWVQPDTGEPATWSLAAIGVHAIVSAMTEPADPAERAEGTERAEPDGPR